MERLGDVAAQAASQILEQQNEKTIGDTRVIDQNRNGVIDRGDLAISYKGHGGSDTIIRQSVSEYLDSNPSSKLAQLVQANGKY